MSTGALTMTWRQHPDFPLHEISEHGDVRRRYAGKTRSAGYLCRPYVDTDGYLVIKLPDASGRKRHIPIHRLVAEAFIGIQNDQTLEVAHRNGSRLCNHFSNLEWKTRRDNWRDADVHQTSTRGEGNGRSKITEDDVRYIRREYRRIKRPMSGRTVDELEIRFGLHRATILDIAKGRTWQHIPIESL